MKRVLLLLLIAASAISVSAQKDYRDNDREKRYHYKHERRNDVRNRYDHNNSRNNREYQRQMAQINAEFDSRTRSIRKNPFMGRNQKNRKIHELEMHRRAALRECRNRFSHRGRDYARERNLNYRNK